MSLRLDLQNATAQVFGVAESMLADITFRAVSDSVYSPPTGEVELTYIDYEIRAALSSFKKHETTVGITSGSNQYPQMVQPQDIKCAFPRQTVGLPTYFEPKLTDILFEESSPGRTWDIVRVLSPPGEAIVILHLRQT